MQSVPKICIVALTGVLLFSSYALSQTRQPNQPIRADDGKTLLDKFSKNGTGGPAPRQDLVGFWAGPPTPKLNDVPPMTPWGQEQFRAHKGHTQYSEEESNDPMKFCDPLGFPRDMIYQTRGIAFAQMPGKMLELSQFNRVWREIWTDGRALPKNVGGRSADAPDPRWYGYSVGHWNGDYTFVVDTVGSDDRSWLDTLGHPHSLDMRVQERYTREDHNTLGMTITIDDPKTYTKPFVITSSHFKWIPSQDVVEEICVPSLMQEYLKIMDGSADETSGK
jgi:hypothetical protein